MATTARDAAQLIDRLPGLRRLLLPIGLVLLATALFKPVSRGGMADFEVYRQAGMRVAGAEPLYRADDGHFTLKYLPAFAMAMAPIAAFDQDAARVAWYGLSFFCLALLLRWSVRALPERHLSEGALVLVTFLLLAKFYAHELTLGQANLMLGVLLLAALTALRRHSPKLAAVCLGVAVFVKPYAAIFLPWFMLVTGAAEVAIAGATIGLGLVLPVLIYGWGGNLTQLSGWWQIVSESTVPNLLNADNISLAGMWAKWLGPGPLATTLSAVSAVWLLALVVTMWRQRDRVASPEYLEYAFLMLLIPLLSPQGWDYVLLLATPAVVCLADRWKQLPPLWRWTSGAALVVMGFSIFDVMGRERYLQFMMWSVVSVCAIVLALTLAQLRRRALA